MLNARFRANRSQLPGVSVARQLPTGNGGRSRGCRRAEPPARGAGRSGRPLSEDTEQIAQASVRP
jgi:hypothetical protein